MEVHEAAGIAFHQATTIDRRAVPEAGHSSGSSKDQLMHIKYLEQKSAVRTLVHVVSLFSVRLHVLHDILI